MNNNTTKLVSSKMRRHEISSISIEDLRKELEDRGQQDNTARNIFNAFTPTLTFGLGAAVAVATSPITAAAVAAAALVSSVFAIYSMSV
jgi:uncharacterized protein YhdP